MTSKRSRDPSSEGGLVQSPGSEAAPASLPLLALLLSASALLFTACGTLEVGFVSPTAVSDGGGNSKVVAPTSEDTPLIPPMATTADLPTYDFARTPIATPTPIAPERAGYPPETRTGIQIVDAVIEAVLADDLEAERELIHYTTTGCTTVSGLGGPPKCRADEAEGTSVEVFPVLGVEGRHVRREDIDRVFLPGSKALYAVYHVPADAYEEDYYPAGGYGVVFVHSNPQRPYPVATTFHVGDNGIVRVVYSESPTTSLELEFGVKVEEFILPPIAPSKCSDGA